jgi:hypothetical protein
VQISINPARLKSISLSQNHATMDEKIAITITTMSSSHHVSLAPAAMTTAASDGYCTSSAAFDCEGAAGSIKGCSKKTAITRDVQITSRMIRNM